MNSQEHSEPLLPGLSREFGVAHGNARAVYVQAVVPNQCCCQALLWDLHGGQGEGLPPAHSLTRESACDCPLEQRWHYFSPFLLKRETKEERHRAVRAVHCCRGTVRSLGVRELVILLHISPVLWKQSDGRCHLNGWACPEIKFFGTVSIYFSYIIP